RSALYPEATGFRLPSRPDLAKGRAFCFLRRCLETREGWERAGGGDGARLCDVANFRAVADAGQPWSARGRGLGTGWQLFRRRRTGGGQETSCLAQGGVARQAR